jgi:superoxide dismutase, Cu-Zn family
MRSFSAVFPVLLVSLVAFSGCEMERDTTPADTDDVTEPAQSSAQGDQAATGDPDRPRSGVDTSRNQPLAPTNQSRTAGTVATPTTPGAGGEELQAVAEIAPTEGNEVGGTVRLSSGNGTVRIAGTITGLEPGEHGFHIHEFGDCSAPDASSAGEHFNPHDDPHGSPRDPEGSHHVGDFGNLIAGEDGRAEIDIEDPEVMLSGEESVIGKAFIVHADRDDLKTQPSGNSGARLGCGEIVEERQTGTGEQ